MKTRQKSSRVRLVPWEEVRERILQDPAVRFYYEQLKIRDQVGTALAAARKRAGLTQAQVAERAGTAQAVVARLEGCRGGVPSLPLLDRIARAVGLRLTLGFESKRAA